MVVLIAEIVGYLLAMLGARGRSLVAWSLAVLAFDILRFRRSMIMKNLQRVYGSASSARVRAEVGRASVANFILTTIEFFSAHRVFPKYDIRFKNPEIIRAALARGQGVYLMGMHMGNFELMGTAVGRNFARVHAPVKPIGKGALARWVGKRRESNGIVEIFNERANGSSRTARLMEGLRLNEIVGFMVDQRRKKGLLLPFFSEPAWTNTGLIFLWKQRSAPIHPVTIARRGLMSAEVTFHDEFIPEQKAGWSAEEFVLENTKRMNQVVEQLILANPKEYFWMHDRWKK